jgi:hypothetical protein
VGQGRRRHMVLRVALRSLAGLLKRWTVR